MCAGVPDMDGNGLVDGEQDSCRGDSGGPLICDVDGKYVLTGIVAWGAKCAKEGYTGVYGRVHTYLRYRFCKSIVQIFSYNEYNLYI